jgi:hypothetical protein
VLESQRRQNSLGTQKSGLGKTGFLDQFCGSLIATETPKVQIS